MTEEAHASAIRRLVDDLLIAHPPVVDAVVALAHACGRALAVRIVGDRVVAADPAGTVGDAWPDTREIEVVRGVDTWIEGGSRPGDRFLRERLAVVVSVLADREGLVAPQLDTGRAVSLLVDPDTSRALRAQALVRLGMRDSTRLHAFTVAGPPAGVERFAGALAAGGRRVHIVTREHTTLCLRLGEHDDLDLLDLPRGVHAGVSRVHPSSCAFDARAEADGIFRFTQPSLRDRRPYRPEEGALGHIDGLGGYEALAEAMEPEHIARVHDVRGLDAALSAGPDMLQTLDTVVVTNSIRAAARTLQLHHNTVLHRVAQAERLMGYQLENSYGRSRLFFALMLRRLRETHGMV